LRVIQTLAIECRRHGMSAKFSAFVTVGAGRPLLEEALDPFFEVLQLWEDGCFLGGPAGVRHALFGDPVIPGTRATLLKRQPEEVSIIDPMHRGPAAEPVTHIRRTPFSPAKPMRIGTQPWSPSPWTFGGKCTTGALRPAIDDSANELHW
jgi:hypothetical protein